MLQLFVHNKNYEEMYKHVPKDLLPAEYGGNGGNIKDIIGRYNKKPQCICISFWNGLLFG